MKKSFIIIAFCLGCLYCYSQEGVGINQNEEDLKELISEFRKEKENLISTVRWTTAFLIGALGFLYFILSKDLFKRKNKIETPDENERYYHELYSSIVFHPTFSKQIDLLSQIDSTKSKQILEEFSERKNIINLYSQNQGIQRSGLDYLNNKGTKISLTYLNDYISKSTDSKLKKYAKDVTDKISRR